ncbi:hypothetical protein KC318_g124 [Hortaea werneckii]|nr:hypothetical protein KC334_g253 [Hortaea werneckii]KAI7027826.1 hypothetical protein KC355_g190 [Hortaea werneckii]KAI7676662.1 hypothetical protein KC318_g124 [Hortaea werneckii]
MTRSCHFHTTFSCPDGFDRPDKRLITRDRAGDPFETSWGGQWWTLLSCPTKECDHHYDEPEAHIDTVIIAVDGACRDNGKPYAKAGYGVFFHRDNHSWNECKILFNAAKTSQKAELTAGLIGLRRAKRLTLLNTDHCGKTRRPGPMRKLRRVIIKADSAYLVNAMTKWVFKWRNNNYTSCRGRPVRNASLFRKLDAEVQELAELNVYVQFLHVRREQNREADLLANAALDGKTASEALTEFFCD